MAIEVVCSLESLSPLSFSRHYEVPRLNDKESHDEYETRTWREKAHADNDGLIFIPPMAFKLSLDAAAQRMAIKIPGRRGATYAQYFRSGVLVLEGMPLGIRKDKMGGERLFLPSDGKKGGGKRVWRWFPLIPQWSGLVTFHVLDMTIPEKVFLDVLHEAGNFVGLHRFRPANQGYYGRFRVVDHEWKKQQVAA